MYSVARRRKGLLIVSLPVPVPAEEEWPHRRRTFASGLRPKQRYAIVRSVVFEDDRKGAIGVSELHGRHVRLPTVLFQTLEQRVVIVLVAERESVRVVRIAQRQLLWKYVPFGNCVGAE